MALTTYAELQTSIADWLNRTDLTATIPDFIALAEAEMKRRLRVAVVRDDDFDIDDVEVDLPSDLGELRSLRLISSTGTLDAPLRRCTMEMLNERKAREGTTGRPTDYAILGDKLYVAPEPDTTYTAELIYFQALVPLSDTETTNAILDDAPDAYLFGSLLQAAPYLEHDERIATWREKFDRAIDQLNEQRQQQEYSGSLGAIRLPYGGFSA